MTDPVHAVRGSRLVDRGDREGDKQKEYEPVRGRSQREIEKAVDEYAKAASKRADRSTSSQIIIGGVCAATATAAAPHTAAADAPPLITLSTAQGST